MTRENRYDMRQEIDGTPLMMLDIEEADDAIDLLNRLDDEKRSSTSQ